MIYITDSGERCACERDVAFLDVPAIIPQEEVVWLIENVPGTPSRRKVVAVVKEADWLDVELEAFPDRYTLSEVGAMLHGEAREEVIAWLKRWPSTYLDQIVLEAEATHRACKVGATSPGRDLWERRRMWLGDVKAWNMERLPR